MGFVFGVNALRKVVAGFVSRVLTSCTHVLSFVIKP